MLALSTRRAAVASLVAACFTAPAWAQTAGTPIAAGQNPLSVAVNPILNKVYVGNAGDQHVTGTSSVTVINATTGTVVTSLPASDYTRWLAINTESGKLYASGLLGRHTKVFGPSDNQMADLDTSNTGWTAIDPWNGQVYVIRYGDSDEFNWIAENAPNAAPTYESASATRSLRPTSLAYNPVTQRLYMVHELTGDVVAMDLTGGYSAYPTLVCGNGAGGYKPQPTTVPLPVPPGYVDPWNNNTNPPTSQKMHPCIDVTDTPKWVALNPVTNRVYAINDATTNQVQVINGATDDITGAVNVPGMTGGSLIAVNPISNKVYAVFANGVAQIDGASNAVAPFPTSGTPVGIAINTFTNKAYVPMSNSTMLVINGNNNTSVTVPIPAGATAIAVNPLTNTVYITHSSGQVTPVVGLSSDTVASTGITTTISALSGNSSGASGSITLNASSSFAAAPLNRIRKVYFRIDNGAWKEATGSGPYNAAYTGLSNGSHTLQAFATNGMEAPSANTDLAHVPVFGNIAAYGFSVASSGAAVASVSPASLDFGGQSMNTTSPPQVVTVSNTGSGTLTVNGIALTGSGSSQYAQSNNCTSVAPGASCTISVTFTPAIIAGAALNSSTPVAASLVISSNAASSPSSVGLSGAAEKSLVSHFYRSILRRAPDDGGKAYWQGEAQRVANLGANVNEAWYALSATFFASGEYAALNRNDDGFVTDLYVTFFNRQPDDGGKGFWLGNLANGMPREVVLVSFMFSAEFRGFTQAIFGNTAARAEVDTVGDFYRGLLARLPDSGGFNYWVGQFRTAQCQGASAVTTQAEAISSAFATGGEYSARGRTNAQYVGDLYNAFLRRGGDLDGVKYWINQVDTGAQTREQVRKQFVASSEFSARVQAVINQGCTN